MFNDFDKFLMEKAFLVLNSHHVIPAMNNHPSNYSVEHVTLNYLLSPQIISMAEKRVGTPLLISVPTTWFISIPEDLPSGAFTQDPSRFALEGFAERNTCAKAKPIARLFYIYLGE